MSNKLFLLATINSFIVVFYLGLASFFAYHNNTPFIWVCGFISLGHVWIVKTLYELAD